MYQSNFKYNSEDAKRDYLAFSCYITGLDFLLFGLFYSFVDEG